jgi:hypothetical protein
MSSWPLLVFIFLVWCLWLIASVFQRAVADARRGVPEHERGGVSVLPGIPVFPLAFWGVALLIDRVANPWGTLIVGFLHAFFGVFLTAIIVRAWWHLRSLDRPA